MKTLVRIHTMAADVGSVRPRVPRVAQAISALSNGAGTAGLLMWRGQEIKVEGGGHGAGGYQSVKSLNRGKGKEIMLHAPHFFCRPANESPGIINRC